MLHASKQDAQLLQPTYSQMKVMTESGDWQDVENVPATIRTKQFARVLPALRLRTNNQVQGTAQVTLTRRCRPMPKLTKHIYN
jgi:hypothetical protein